MIGRLRRVYGDTPLHALAHLASFALAGFAILQLVDVRPHLYVLGWFVGAVVLHDFLLLPFYGILDRAGAVTLRGAVNYVRVPVVLSGLLLLVYFPVILGRGEAAYARVSGLEYEGYAQRWLLVSAVLFLGSAVLYGVRAFGRRSAGSSS